MTVDEIFSQLAAHMVEGLMTHSQLSDYFGFLGLEGYEEAHKYHYFCENANYRALSKYYLFHYNKIVPERSIPNPHIIPDSWYKYTRQDVNATTRKNAIQSAMEVWINWETQTKKLYEQMYQELININEVAAAKEVAKYICDVDEELAKAKQKDLELRAMDYDISVIIDKQKEKYKKYKKKIKEIDLC